MSATPSLISRTGPESAPEAALQVISGLADGRGSLAAQDNTANTEDCTNVLAGSYTVLEGTEPANFTLESLTCTATGGSSGSQDGTNTFQANITVTPGGPAAPAARRTA